MFYRFEVSRIKALVFTAFLMAFSLFFVMGSDAQFSDIPHDKNQWNIGLFGNKESTNYNTTFLAPFRKDNVTGWAGTYASKVISGDDVLSERFNAHIEGGFSIKSLNDLGLRAFVDFETTHQKTSQLQFGLFVIPGVYERGKLKISGGVGNFLEDTNVRDDLGLKETDSVVSRLLVYSSFHFERFALLVRATPHINLSDFQLDIEPSYALKLSDNISLRFHCKMEYDSEPLDESFSTEYALQLGLGL